METTQLNNQADVKIAEYPIGKGENKATLAILFGGIGSSTPKNLLDAAVQKYVGNETYYDFIDIYLDNPWLRVVIKGIERLEDSEFTDFQKKFKDFNVADYIN